MNKENKFKKSQKAHERLMWYHFDNMDEHCSGKHSPNHHKHLVGYNYHSMCLNEQRKQNCILSDKHKKWIYKSSIRMSN